MKVAWFARHFRIVMLHRAASSVFPPSRLRVLAWYDAIYNALADHGHLVRQAADLTARAKRAHEVSWVLMRQAAVCLDIPVLDYDVLCTADRDQVQRTLLGRNVAGVLRGSDPGLAGEAFHLAKRKVAPSPETAKPVRGRR